MNNRNLSERILRLPQLVEKLGKSKSAIYKEMAEGSFPQSVNLGGRSVGWLEQEIDTWLAKKIADRKSQNGGGTNE